MECFGKAPLKPQKVAQRLSGPRPDTSTGGRSRTGLFATFRFAHGPKHDFLVSEIRLGAAGHLSRAGLLRASVTGIRVCDAGKPPLRPIGAGRNSFRALGRALPRLSITVTRKLWDCCPGAGGRYG